MAQRTRKARRRNRKIDSRTALLLLVVVVSSFAVIMGFRFQALSSAYRRYEMQYETAQKTLAAEEQRLSDLQAQQNRKQTDEDIEKAAREQLGLILPGEILLKPNQ